MLSLPVKKYNILWICFLIGFCLAQNTAIDSSKIKDPSLAWKVSFVPGLGQLYNERYLKFIGLLSAEFYAFNKFNHLRDSGNITKRNTYGWWIVGLYFYGILDAYVDAHLSTFPKEIKDDNDSSENKSDSLKMEIK